MKRSVAACLASLLAAASVPAAPTPAGAPTTQSVDAIFSGIPADAPGCAVIASRDGVVLVRRAYGLADLELKVPITPDSIFEAGSSSKQFVAATVVLLARQGRISLADDIRKYLPEMPDYGRAITVGDLIHHTSGLRDWDMLVGLEGWPRNTRQTYNEDVLAIVAQQKTLNFPPGDHVLYSNSNFNLLPILVERATGQPFEQVSQKLIFDPLGMTHTSWRNDYRRIVPGRVAAYQTTKAGYRNARVIEDAYGNGGLLTTIDDLARWQNALDRDQLGPGFTAAMEEPGRLRDGSRTHYGAGLFLDRYHGLIEVQHEGLTAGYHAWVARYPTQKVAVAMLCNATGIRVDRLGRRLADLLLPPAPAALPPSTATVPSGTYVDAWTGIPIQIALDGRGGLSVDGEVADYLGHDRWRIWTEVYAITAGVLTRESAEGEIYRYRRVEPMKAPSTSAYEGYYCASEVTACVTVHSDGGALTSRGSRGEPQPLTPVYADTFIGTVFPGQGKIVMAFQRSATGEVGGLKMSDERTLGVAFVRTR